MADVAPTASEGSEAAPAEAVVASGAASIADVVKAEAAPVTDRPDDLPEDLWDAEAKAPKYADIKTRVEKAAAFEEIAATVVDSADKIDWKIDLKTPDGQEIDWDLEDPLFKAVGATVVEHKIPTAYLKPLMKAYAEAQFAADAARVSETKAEYEKLGDKREARVQGTFKWLTDIVGEDKAKGFVMTLGRADQVEVIEALMEHFKDPNPGPNGSGDDKGLMQTNPGRVFFGKKAA